MSDNDKITLEVLLQAQAIKPTKHKKFHLTVDSPPLVVEAHRLWKEGFLEVSSHLQMISSGTFFNVDGLTRTGRQLLTELQQR